MATLEEYFAKDGSNNLTLHEKWKVNDVTSKQCAGEITARLHFDFEANAKYISFFIPISTSGFNPESEILTHIDQILTWDRDKIQIITGFGSENTNANELIFTGKIYIYSEMPIVSESKNHLLEIANKKNYNIIFRSKEYMDSRNKIEKPLAFISHDSRDKHKIAAPIANKLQLMMCPVWYDEYSLHVGDSLRESIENGLKECSKCILILTPNFLNNNGWSKREYDSIFTRELVERQRVILPVWSEVEASDVYKYSPILADRVAVNWNLGIDEVARKLFRSINRQ